MGLGFSFGSAFQAQAQIDPNAQSRVQSYTIPLTAGIAETQFGSVSGAAPREFNVLEGLLEDPLQQIKRKLNRNNVGACLDDASFVVVLFYYNEAHQEPQDDILSNNYKKYLELSKKNPNPADPNDLLKTKDILKLRDILAYFAKHLNVPPEIMSEFFKSDRDRDKRGFAVRAINYYVSHPPGQPLNAKPLAAARPANEKRFIITALPVSFCAAKVTIKASVPFNPTDETNVLKANLNNSPGTSWGYGGMLQAFVPVTTAAHPSFDVVGFSAQSQSVRYAQYPTKSFDSITTQAAYQFFLDATGIESNGLRPQGLGPDGAPSRFSITRDTPKDQIDIGAIPPVGMITIDSVAFGFQNQTVFTTAFHKETVDLFTPQITFNRQNQDLSGNGASCRAAIPDPRKDGFCFYADFAVTFGQTLSDVASQTNTNLAFSVTPGVRIPSTDWKFTLPVTVTGREYENVVGGRQDALFQIGPALTYAPPSFTSRDGQIYAVTFSLPVTYNRNYSMVAVDAWHGFVVMPTLTVAFQPPIK